MNRLTPFVHDTSGYNITKSLLLEQMLHELNKIMSKMPQCPSARQKQWEAKAIAGEVGERMSLVREPGRLGSSKRYLNAA